MPEVIDIINYKCGLCVYDKAKIISHILYDLFAFTFDFVIWYTLGMG